MNKEQPSNHEAGTGFKVMISIITSIAILAAIHFYTEYEFAMVTSSISEEDKLILSGVLGTKGDYYGGLLNPIFGFLSLMALLYTIVLQSRELSLSRQELEATKNEVKRSADAQEKSEQALNGQLSLQAKQSFESTFFNLLSLHNSILNSTTVDLSSVGKTLSEKYEIPGAWRGFGSNTEWVPAKTEYVGRDAFRELLALLVKLTDEDPRSVYKAYAQVNDHHNELLGHYFRNLYQILRFIVEGEISDKEKHRYASILRAQLSSFELAILFLNCLDDTVDSGSFRNLLCKFKILEHLPILQANIDADDNHGLLALYTFANSDMTIANKEMVEQYLQPKTRNSNNQIEFGAFGTNRVITEVYSE